MIFIIAGSPCSGKSTFVKEHAKEGDLIYDYDLIHSALSLQKSHHHLQGIRPFVLKCRDSIYELLETNKNISAWIITSTPRQNNLDVLKERFEASVLVMSISREEAHARCDESERPDEWHQYIDNWFDGSDIKSNQDFQRKEMMVKKIETKTYRGKMQFKQDGENGEFRAVFATLNVIDHDDDVTLPGAFGEQDVLVEQWNHDWTLPVGKGTIGEEGDEVIVDGRFFLEIPAAKAHYIVAKELQEKQEWSYTFRILEWKQGEFEGRKVRFLEKLEVIGVSQVSRGAGINTRTTAIKALKDLLGDGETVDEDVQSGEDVPDGDDIPDGDDVPVSKKPDETESEAGDPGNESGADPEDAQTYFEILARRCTDA